MHFEREQSYVKCNRHKFSVNTVTQCWACVMLVTVLFFGSYRDSEPSNVTTLHFCCSLGKGSCGRLCFAYHRPLPSFVFTASNPHDVPSTRIGSTDAQQPKLARMMNNPVVLMSPQSQHPNSVRPGLPPAILHNRAPSEWHWALAMSKNAWFRTPQNMATVVLPVQQGETSPASRLEARNATQKYFANEPLLRRLHDQSRRRHRQENTQLLFWCGPADVAAKSTAPRPSR